MAHARGPRGRSGEAPAPQPFHERRGARHRPVDEVRCGRQRHGTASRCVPAPRAHPATRIRAKPPGQARSRLPPGPERPPLRFDCRPLPSLDTQPSRVPLRERKGLHGFYLHSQRSEHVREGRSRPRVPSGGRLRRRTADPDAVPHAEPTPVAVNESVVVSATRSPETELEIPGEATVVTGEQLRQRGVTNLADGIQDVMGIDTGMGSDNGPRQPNVGIWGLKEFDALLFMVDGVPIGGPFLPQLAQIDIDDVDHIEIVKGPQGTLYGVSAFAGMVQVFTKSGQAGTYHLAGRRLLQRRPGQRLDDDSDRKGHLQGLRRLRQADRRLAAEHRLPGQPRRLPLRHAAARTAATSSSSYNMFLNQQQFGSPLPVDPPTGEVIPGFKPDSNYEPLGARVDHRVYALTVSATIPINKTTSLQNMLGLTKDDAHDRPELRRPASTTSTTNIASSTGDNLKPRENDLYDDLHLVTNFQAAGSHRLVGGAADHDGPDQVDRLQLRLRLPDRPRHRAEPDRHPGDGPELDQGPSHLRRLLRQRPVDAGPLPDDLGRRALRHHVRDA